MMKSENISNDVVKKLMVSGKSRHFLTYGEIQDALSELDLSPEQMDDIYVQFSQAGIDVIDESADLDTIDAPENLDVIEEVVVEEVAAAEIAVPEGVFVDDP
ncbi:MAG: RNA polymerase sigma factor region1.1 domain-containing protein, partial [Clostridiales bacterium]